MAWIESHQSLRDHRKTKALRRVLKIKTPQAIGHLHLLWWWCLDNAPDGNLSDIPSEDLADAAMWTGNPENFVNALIDAGFIDQETRQLHDWFDYAGKLLSKNETRKEQNRLAQQRHRARFTADNTPCQHNVSIMLSDSNTPTKPNQTKPTIITNVIIPDWIDDDVWNSFLEMRKKKKATPTDYAKTLLIKNLEALRAAGNDPNEVLKESIKNNWTGIFALKKENNLLSIKKALVSSSEKVEGFF